MGVPIINNYLCVEKISKGAFGEVWKAIYRDEYNSDNLHKKDNLVAIKVEKKERKSQLRNEYTMLSYINSTLHITPHVFQLGETSTCLLYTSDAADE